MGNLINVIFVFFPGKMDEKKEEDKEIEVIKPRTYQVKSTFIKNPFNDDSFTKWLKLWTSF